MTACIPHEYLRTPLADGGLLMSTVASELASEELAIPTPYYQYRLTRAHTTRDQFQALVEQYSKDWCFCLHNADEQEENCKKEHFHAVFRDFEKKDVDKFRLAMKTHFECRGNADHAGKMQHNHISQAIGYFKHDPDVEIVHSGQSHWINFIENVPAFIKKDQGRPVFKRERLSHPVLTYSNVLKQALAYHKEHAMRTVLLSDVVEEMVNTDNWWPSRELLTNGIPTETHQRFSDMVQNKRTKLSFWLPHERSEKKREWQDRVADGWYPTGVSSLGCPTDSKRLWSEKKFEPPPSI